MSDATPVTPLKYRAFISSSHADKAWADWLRKALERYRIPAKLFGMREAATEHACNLLAPSAQSTLTAGELRAAPFLSLERDTDPCLSKSPRQRLFAWL